MGRGLEGGVIPGLMVALSEVPELDPVGLAVYVPGGGWSSPGEPLGSLAVGYGRFPSDEGGPDRPGVRVSGGTMLLERVHVSLADSATRDRIERWDRLRDFVCAEAGQRVLYRGVSERLGSVEASFLLLDHRGPVTTWVRLPALAEIDPHDDTRLPDGSRLVDALALAAVCRAVGGAS